MNDINFKKQNAPSPKVHKYYQIISKKFLTLKFLKKPMQVSNQLLNRQGIRENICNIMFYIIIQSELALP